MSTAEATRRQVGAPAPRIPDGWGRALRFALRAARRDWRSGEMRVLFAALALAVASIGAVGTFGARMTRALLGGAGELLGADLAVSSSRPLPSTLADRATRLGLELTRTESFTTALNRDGRFVLAAVMAVGRGYPLRGALRTAAQPYRAGRVTAHGPPPGVVWPDPRLASRLDLRPGEPLQVGRARLRVGRILAYAPDSGARLIALAPRLMMNRADVAATGLVARGSRVRYRLLVAGNEAALGRFRRYAQAHLGAEQSLRDARDAQPRLREALSRATRYLGLAALVSVLLAGVAIAIAARRHAARHLDRAALMRCLGASARLVLRIHLCEMLLVGATAGVAGMFAGYAAQAVLARSVAHLLSAALPGAGVAPLLVGFAAGLLTLVGFAIPPVMGLRRSPPARVLRSDLGAPAPSAWLVYGFGTVALLGLVALQAGDARLAGIATGGAVLTVLVLALAARAMVALLAGLRAGAPGPWRQGLANIVRHPGTSVTSMVAAGLGVAMLLLLHALRTGLVDAWRAQLPERAPNYFLINIQPVEVAAVRLALRGAGLRAATLHPMVRARLLAIDGREVHPDGYRQLRARRLAAHVFNLSWSTRVPEDNRVVAGRFWSPGTRDVDQLSVERGIASTLGIRLGAKLTFESAGTRISARVTSLRKVDWDSFRVNFFVIAAPGLLEHLPATWATSFYLPPARHGVLEALAGRFPNVTVIDVGALMRLVRGVIDQASAAIAFIFGFTVLAGIVVLFAAIQATIDERRNEAAILRTLGARRRYLVGAVISEFATLGALAGLIASAAASELATLIARHLFGLSFTPGWTLWVLGVVGTCAGITAAGVAGTRRVLRQPPLRNLASS